MDRKVIVLSPKEWNSRIELGQAMQQAYNHTHFAVTNEATLQSILWGLKNKVEKGFAKGYLIEAIEKAMKYSSNITTEIRTAQNYVGNVATMIEYKFNQELESDDKCQ